MLGAGAGSGMLGTGDVFSTLILSTTDLLYSLLYMYPKKMVLSTKRVARKKVALAKNPCGPFAPKSDSLLPLYAPSPMEELFCSKIMIVKITAKTICRMKRILIICVPCQKFEPIISNLR